MTSTIRIGKTFLFSLWKWPNMEITIAVTPLNVLLFFLAFVTAFLTTLGIIYVTVIYWYSTFWEFCGALVTITLVGLFWPVTLGVYLLYVLVEHKKG